MAINSDAYSQLREDLDSKNVTLVAVSKTKPAEDIQALYDLGHRDFGENYVQELTAKAAELPKDIRWHFIGHLQRNKVKFIAPFVHLIHGVDSFRLLEEINNQSLKLNRVTNCLLQAHIAEEETKFGFDDSELDQLLETLPKYMQLNKLANVNVMGLMGMASFTEDMSQVRKEFQHLRNMFEKAHTKNTAMSVLSMGMSSDYRIAIEEGSTMVRIGSLLFGERVYK